MRTGACDGRGGEGRRGGQGGESAERGEGREGRGQRGERAECGEGRVRRGSRGELVARAGPSTRRSESIVNVIDMIYLGLVASYYRYTVQQHDVLNVIK